MSFWRRFFGKNCQKAYQPSANDEVEKVARRITGKSIDMIVKYSELDNFVSPVILNLCVLRRIPSDLSQVIKAVCPTCGVKISTEWLALASAREVPVEGLGPQRCHKCGADHFKAIFLDITAEEIVRLGRDQFFSKLSALS
jgi:hypothetical protein